MCPAIYSRLVISRVLESGGRRFGARTRLALLSQTRFISFSKTAGQLQIRSVGRPP